MQDNDNKLPSLVLLDRDGVVNHDVGSLGVVRPDQLQLTPRAGWAIAKLQRAGCRVARARHQPKLRRQRTCRRGTITGHA